MTPSLFVFPFSQTSCQALLSLLAKEVAVPLPTWAAQDWVTTAPSHAGTAQVLPQAQTGLGAGKLGENSAKVLRDHQ